VARRKQIAQLVECEQYQDAYGYGSMKLSSKDEPDEPDFPAKIDRKSILSQSAQSSKASGTVMVSFTRE
jgi:hypothetical protein